MIAAALSHYLDAQDLVTYEPEGGGDCFVHHLPDEPEEAVSVTAYGANAVTASDALGYDEPTVQVRVRGTQDPSTGEARAQAIYGALQGLTHVTMAAGTEHEVRVISVDCPQTGPIYMGTDERGRHEYVVNTALHVRAETAHRE